ncbi:SMP-30/gluconolactonase/LRE family protein [Maribacter sp. CXY002]|uniref:SMP-30/gluconolactonase/LRE family protein n=1 Tax=Maribacter luteocoastalis TaxID=3407671 RepID=UPI003B66BB75
MKIEVVHNHQCELGEGPVWDAQEEVIFWVDILQGEIHHYSLQRKQHKTYAVNEMVGCIALCNDGNFILASKSGIGFLNRATGEIEYVENPESHLPENRFNDGKCDAVGRLWVGSMSLLETPNAGSVYVFENNRSTLKIKKTTISNGMAWSADNKIYYFIDTPTATVVAYDFDLNTGSISNKRVVIAIDEKEGYPDGMTIDQEGMLWIAHWGGWQVTRWDPNTGELLYRIKLPAAKITSCTFGGTQLNDLFITSAKADLTDEELKNQPLAGSLFVIKNCGYQGVPAFKFNR